MSEPEEPAHAVEEVNRTNRGQLQPKRLYLGRDCGGQGEVKYRAASGIRARPHSAVVGFDDGTRNRQSHAGALRLGCKEGIKDLFQLFWRQAYAGVAY